MMGTFWMGIWMLRYLMTWLPKLRTMITMKERISSETTLISMCILSVDLAWRSLITRTPEYYCRDEADLQGGLNDTYGDADIDDEEYEDLTVEQRRAAEVEMTRRDRGTLRRGGRTTTRRRLDFIESDEEEAEDGTMGGIIPPGVKIRARRVYDERRNIDDAEGMDEADELPVEELSDIKANSLSEWIATPRVRKALENQFRRFLLTYVDDESGKSVYGERIRILGESKYDVRRGSCYLIYPPYSEF